MGSGQLKWKFSQLQNVSKEIYSPTTRINGKGTDTWLTTVKMPFT